MLIKTVVYFCFALISFAQQNSSPPRLLSSSEDPVDANVRRSRSRIFDVPSSFKILTPPKVAPGAPPPPPPGTIVDLVPTVELPIEVSDAVVVGDIVRVQTFLTESQSALYTEYSVAVTDTIKSTSAAPVSALTILRRGGIALTEDNRRIEWRVTGEGDRFQPGERYLFFLEYRSDLDCYLVVKAWHADGALLKAAYPNEKAAAAKFASQNDGKLLAEVVQNLKGTRK